MRNHVGYATEPSLKEMGSPRPAAASSPLKARTPVFLPTCVPWLHSCHGRPSGDAAFQRVGSWFNSLGLESPQNHGNPTYPVTCDQICLVKLPLAAEGSGLRKWLPNSKESVLLTDLRSSEDSWSHTTHPTCPIRSIRRV